MRLGAPLWLGELGCFADQLVQIERHKDIALLARPVEIPQAGHDMRRITPGCEHDFQIFPHHFRIAQRAFVAEKQLAVADYRDQGVVEIMHHPAGHLAKGAEAFALHDLVLAVPQFLGPLGDLFLKEHILVLEFEVEESAAEHPANPHEDFRGIERLVQDVRGTGGECLALVLRRGGAAEHDDREHKIIRMGRTDLSDQIDTVHLRHGEIGDDDIRRVRHYFRPDVQRVAEFANIREAQTVQDVFEQAEITHLIIHHEDACLPQGVFFHWRGSGSALRHGMHGLAQQAFHGSIEGLRVHWLREEGHPPTHDRIVRSLIGRDQ